MSSQLIANLGGEVARKLVNRRTRRDSSEPGDGRAPLADPGRLVWHLLEGTCRCKKDGFTLGEEEGVSDLERELADQKPVR